MMPRRRHARASILRLGISDYPIRVPPTGLRGADMSRDPHLKSLFHELCYYTLSHNDRSFIHQVVVDAYAAQTADETSKPIGVAFALLGLYLHHERGYT